VILEEGHGFHRGRSVFRTKNPGNSGMNWVGGNQIGSKKGIILGGKKFSGTKISLFQAMIDIHHSTCSKGSAAAIYLGNTRNVELYPKHLLSKNKIYFLELIRL
jgi:hypothetical protein